MPHSCTLLLQHSGILLVQHNGLMDAASPELHVKFISGTERNQNLKIRYAAFLSITELWKVHLEITTSKT
jgi:hypothetical protein